MSEVTYQVSKLARGTVLDHLRAGTALRAFRVLNLPVNTTAAIGVNLHSRRLGRKDILKIEDYELTPDQAAKVALLSPDATLSIIRDYAVLRKQPLAPPASFRGLLRCVNPACIVHAEKVAGSFTVERRDPFLVRCDYCERTFEEGQFEFA